MDHKSFDEIITRLEPLVSGLGELENVLGPQARPAVHRTRQRVLEAMAARDRGDLPGAFQAIGTAMGEIADLAATIDPNEAQLMRAVAAGFQKALGRGDQGTAKEQAAFMMAKSGAKERPKRDGNS